MLNNDNVWKEEHERNIDAARQGDGGMGALKWKGAALQP
jgi:hypothetical protein